MYININYYFISHGSFKNMSSAVSYSLQARTYNTVHREKSMNRPNKLVQFLYAGKTADPLLYFSLVVRSTSLEHATKEWKDSKDPGIFFNCYMENGRDLCWISLHSSIQIANKISELDTVMDARDRTRDFCPDNDSEPIGGNAQPGGLPRPQPDQTSLRQNPGGGRICRQRRMCNGHHGWRHRHYTSGEP